MCVFLCDPGLFFFDELSGSFCPTRTPLVLFPCSQRHIVSSTIVALTPGWAAQRTNCPSLFYTNGVLVPTECSTVLIAPCDDFYEQMQKRTRNQQRGGNVVYQYFLSRKFDLDGFEITGPVPSRLLCSDICKGACDPAVISVNMFQTNRLC